RPQLERRDAVDGARVEDLPRARARRAALARAFAHAGTCFTMSATTSLAFTPADCAWNVTTTRCDSTGTATSFTSSIEAANRPCKTARALAPSTRYCD